MSRTVGFWLLVAVVVLVIAAAALVQPARNGNVWNGRAHQPAAGVAESEAAAGVAPTDETVRRQDRDLNTMGRRLIDKARQGTARDQGLPPEAPVR